MVYYRFENTISYHKGSQLQYLSGHCKSEVSNSYNVKHTSIYFLQACPWFIIAYSAIYTSHYSKVWICYTYEELVYYDFCLFSCILCILFSRFWFVSLISLKTHFNRRKNFQFEPFHVPQRTNLLFKRCRLL